jgi:hypothetical protein
MQDWRMLRALSMILRIVAWIDAIVGGLLVLVTACTTLNASAQYGQYGGQFGAFAGAGLVVVVFEALGVVIGFIVTMALAELIMLFIAIEENTRQSASQRAYPAPAPAYAGSPTTPTP